MPGMDDLYFQMHDPPDRDIYDWTILELRLNALLSIDEKKIKFKIVNRNSIN
jgi:hypothetical protein